MVELPEGDGNPFVCDAATADVCSMAGGTVVQAHKQVIGAGVDVVDETVGRETGGRKLLGGEGGGLQAG